MKKILVLALAVLTIASTFTACSQKSTETEKEPREIIKAEVIDGFLYITYSNDPDTPVNVGTVVFGTVDTNAYGLDFYPLPDGTYGVKAGNSLYLEKIIIPETYNGKKVTQILDKAFEGANNLKEITLPSTVKSISASAFANCKNLISVTIPSGVTSISFGAFSGCSSLTSITIPGSVTSIGESAFFGCSELSSVEFMTPDGWWYASNEAATKGTNISADNLSDPEKAVTLLTNSISSAGYADYYWKRS